MKKKNILLSLLALLGAGITCMGFLYQPQCPG